MTYHRISYLKRYKHLVLKYRCLTVGFLQPTDARKNGSLILGPLGVLLVSSLLLFSCTDKPTTYTHDERKKADSIVRAVRNIDTLALMQKQMDKEGNRLGSIIALRSLGERMRNESRFEEALSVHSEGLRQAEAIGDTLEWVRALNNIGTNYRRMGMLDVAQVYHYNAWKLSEESTDTSYNARKNRVVSLNGLGNIYMTLGNFERADSMLRMALAGERQLGSTLGQAINYANLGSIFERHGELDSARLYYDKSMTLNREVGSTLGISLCHTYFGSLYEKEGKYNEATAEYQAAYRLMQESKDEWHALNTLIALAGIYNETGDNIKAMDYLSTARQVAQKIKSPEHLVEIYTLYYRYYKRLGDYRTALLSFEQAIAMQDSVLDMEKVNRIQNASLNIERNRQEKKMGEAQLRLEQERAARHTAYAIIVSVVVILIGALLTFLYIQRILRRKNMALRQLSALRENFFTNITHELRTPLTVILGLSQDLQQSDTAEVKNKAIAIHRHSEGLLTLINQLLDISKVKSAVGKADWRSGNIMAYLAMVVESYRDYARRRNIDLSFFPKEEVVMDFVPDYVGKVMNNLLSNAFKFTPEYGKVSVMSWREGESLFIDVADTGEGMDKKTLDHVFEPFYQGENGAQHVGTGVGLALVMQIIKAVDGTITVESTEGKGTVFHICVPIQHTGKQQVADGDLETTPLLPKEETVLVDNEGEDMQCRLLVIEDNHDIAAYIGSQFADRYAVCYAENGKVGLEKALDLMPDLIITDLMMPGLDGLELCRQIRGNEITDHIPIIVVTAKVTEDDRIEGLEAGADAYLAKPFNADELRMRVEKMLDRHRRLRDKFSNTAEVADKEHQRTDIERRFLTKTVDTIYHLLDKRQLDVNTLAETLCMSPRQLHRKLVAITGDSPATYMLKIKMQKARILLETKPGLTIEDIAERCGFEHTPNFYNAFKKMYGVTPMNYRKGSGV